MLVSDFYYDLRHELIAQTPLAGRSDSRMLQVSRQNATWRDRKFIELPDLLRSDDLLVLNDTRVIPARLLGRRSGKKAQRLSQRNPAAKEFLKGKVEVLLTKPLGNWEWEALVHPGRKLGVGERMFFSSFLGEPELQAEIIAGEDFGRRRLRFDPVPDFHVFLQKLGHVPLPPYIHRPDTTADRERYQTVYSREPGSVAAPTAGLHFTPETLERIRQRGIGIAYVTLHVGLGTFQPVRTRKVEEHKLHTETHSITPESAGQINRARHAGRRIVAVGTTTTRALEYAASRSRDFDVEPGSGEADIFIYPGYRFKVVQALLTNFHLPQSTLLMLVSAFAGREFILRAYTHAVAERYRFYSYGDCMFIE